MLYLGGDDYHPLQHTSYQDMNQDEIAEILQTSASTISRRLRRAQEKLRDVLKGGREDE